MPEDDGHHARGAGHSSTASMKLNSLETQISTFIASLQNVRRDKTKIQGIQKQVTALETNLYHFFAFLPFDAVIDASPTNIIVDGAMNVTVRSQKLALDSNSEPASWPQNLRSTEQQGAFLLFLLERQMQMPSAENLFSRDRFNNLRTTFAYQLKKTSDPKTPEVAADVQSFFDWEDKIRLLRGQLLVPEAPPAELQFLPLRQFAEQPIEATALLLLRKKMLNYVGVIQPIFWPICEQLMHVSPLTLECRVGWTEDNKNALKTFLADPKSQATPLPFPAGSEGCKVSIVAGMLKQVVACQIRKAEEPGVGASGAPDSDYAGCPFDKQLVDALQNATENPTTVEGLEALIKEHIERLGKRECGSKCTDLDTATLNACLTCCRKYLGQYVKQKGNPMMNTPLHTAIQLGNVNLVLLFRQTFYEYVDAENKSPAFLACELKRHGLLRFLVDPGYCTVEAGCNAFQYLIDKKRVDQSRYDLFARFFSDSRTPTIKQLADKAKMLREYSPKNDGVSETATSQQMDEPPISAIAEHGAGQHLRQPVTSKGSGAAGSKSASEEMQIQEEAKSIKIPPSLQKALQKFPADGQFDIKGCMTTRQEGEAGQREHDELYRYHLTCFLDISSRDGGDAVALCQTFQEQIDTLAFISEAVSRMKVTNQTDAISLVCVAMVKQIISSEAFLPSHLEEIEKQQPNAQQNLQAEDSTSSLHAGAKSSSNQQNSQNQQPQPETSQESTKQKQLRLLCDPLWRALIALGGVEINEPIIQITDMMRPKREGAFTGVMEFIENLMTVKLITDAVNFNNSKKKSTNGKLVFQIPILDNQAIKLFTDLSYAEKTMSVQMRQDMFKWWCLRFAVENEQTTWKEIRECTGLTCIEFPVAFRYPEVIDLKKYSQPVTNNTPGHDGLTVTLELSQDGIIISRIDMDQSKAPETGFGTQNVRAFNWADWTRYTASKLFESAVTEKLVDAVKLYKGISDKGTAIELRLRCLSFGKFRYKRTLSITHGDENFKVPMLIEPMFDGNRGISINSDKERSLLSFEMLSTYAVQRVADPQQKPLGQLLDTVLGTPIVPIFGAAAKTLTLKTAEGECAVYGQTLDEMEKLYRETLGKVNPDGDVTGDDSLADEYFISQFHLEGQTKPADELENAPLQKVLSLFFGMCNRSIVGTPFDGDIDGEQIAFHPLVCRVFLPRLFACWQSKVYRVLRIGTLENNTFRIFKAGDLLGLAKAMTKYGTGQVGQQFAENLESLYLKQPRANEAQ